MLRMFVCVYCDIRKRENSIVKYDDAHDTRALKKSTWARRDRRRVYVMTHIHTMCLREREEDRETAILFRAVSLTQKTRE